MQEVYLLTKNSGKLAVAKQVLDKFGVSCLQLQGDTEEIQALTSVEVARHAACSAAQLYNKVVLREDHSLYINALGIPGPFTHFVEKMIPAEKLLEILSKFSDRTGYYELALCCSGPSGVIAESVYQVQIEFSKELRGSLSSGWDRVLMLLGESRTFAEYPPEERYQVWTRNYERIAPILQRQP